MIINRTKDFFGGLTTIIAGKSKSFNFDGQYGISTAKAGLFSGLSTRVSEFPKGSFINYRTISEFIYEDHVTKDERYEIHDAIVKILDEDIDFGGDILDQLEHITRLYKLSGKIKQAFRT
jgi:hypothetical protein